jgi:DNA polymerase alpha subunit A
MNVESDLNRTFAEPKAEVDTTMDLQDASAKGEDGTLRMYWIDACEVRGTIYIFGKVTFESFKDDRRHGSGRCFVEEASC